MDYTFGRRKETQLMPERSSMKQNIETGKSDELVSLVTQENIADRLQTGDLPILMAFLQRDQYSIEVQIALENVASQFEDKVRVLRVDHRFVPVLSHIYGVAGTPTFVLLDREAEVGGRMLGKSDASGLASFVQRTLEDIEESDAK